MKLPEEQAQVLDEVVQLAINDPQFLDEAKSSSNPVALIASRLGRELTGAQMGKIISFHAMWSNKTNADILQELNREDHDEWPIRIYGYR